MYEPQTVHIPAKRGGCWTYWYTIPLQCLIDELRWSPQESVGLTRQNRYERYIMFPTVRYRNWEVTWHFWFVCWNEKNVTLQWKSLLVQKLYTAV